MERLSFLRLSINCLVALIIPNGHINVFLESNKSETLPFFNSRQLLSIKAILIEFNIYSENSLLQTLNLLERYLINQENKFKVLVLNYLQNYEVNENNTKQNALISQFKILVVKVCYSTPEIFENQKKKYCLNGAF